MSKENIETVISRLYEQVNELGHVKQEIEGEDLERLLEISKKHVEMVEKLVLHQETPESDLCSIGELFLNETGMWD
jgi:hypothetical protein